MPVPIRSWPSAAGQTIEQPSDCPEDRIYGGLGHRVALHHEQEELHQQLLHPDSRATPQHPQGRAVVLAQADLITKDTIRYDTLRLAENIFLQWMRKPQ